MAVSYTHLYNKPGRKLKNAIVAIIKEALANIMKHSNASQAQIILREHPGFYQLIIRDNGQVKAYDPEEGMGLKNMATRIKSFNGNINISTEPVSYTHLDVYKRQTSYRPKRNRS